MESNPKQRYQILRRLVPKRIQPILRGLRKRVTIPKDLEDPYRSVYAFTQAHLDRQRNLVRLAHLIEQRGVEGSIVECGVLDGGTAALMAYSLDSRPVHLFDSWAGLPPATEKDGESGVWAGECVGAPSRVISIMKKFNIAPERLHFHKGWFHETFPAAQLDKIALLHIDADFYDSVKLCLERWYPHVSYGGFIQFDDYDSFIGCRRAVDEFIAMHPNLSLSTTSNIASVRWIEVLP